MYPWMEFTLWLTGILCAATVANNAVNKIGRKR